MPERGPATQHRQEVLDDLLAVGMRFVHRADARAEAEPDTLADMVTVYERAARCVRRTIAMQDHLDRAATRAEKHAAARRRILRNVEDAIEHRVLGEAETGRLTAELYERLETPELLDEIDDRPVDEIIADIRRDLGLDDIHGLHLHKRRTPADILELHARASQPPRAPTSAAGPHNAPERFFRTVPAPLGTRPG